MTELEESFQDLQNQLIEAKRELCEKERSYEHLRKQFFEAGERYKQNLLAIRFMIGQVQEVGTHHEKEVVLRYIKLVIEKDISKTHGYYPETEDLPF